MVSIERSSALGDMHHYMSLHDQGRFRMRIIQKENQPITLISDHYIYNRLEKSFNPMAS